MPLFGDLLIFIVSTIFITSSVKAYSDFIYPLLQRTYYRGRVEDYSSFKKDITYLGSMLLGWSVSLVIWYIYIFLSGYILKGFRPHESFVLILTMICGLVFMASMLSTSWPRQIGSRIVRREWNAQ